MLVDYGPPHFRNLSTRGNISLVQFGFRSMDRNESFKSYNLDVFRMMRLIELVTAWKGKDSRLRRRPDVCTPKIWRINV